MRRAITTTSSSSTDHFRALLLAAALVVGLLLLARPAHAATFTVNSTSTAGDTNLTDDACDAHPLPHVQLCTLRAAIQEANDTPGADTISFQIGGTGVKTISISPNSPLPSIDDPLTIDGYTQTGATPNIETQPGSTNAELRIELRGPGTDPNTVGTMEGLEINAPNVVVRGLVINNFSRNGINISSNGTDAVIEGNFIGTDPLVTSKQGNRFNGVNIRASDGTIGGTMPEARNLISGNTANGVNTSNTTGVEVLGNLIGTNKSGTNNILLGNGGHGVRIGGSGNIVGVNAANTIAFNGEDGVQVFGDGNRILSNSIFNNNELGIDLGNDGVTPNDPDDPDTGSNNLQNLSRISSAVTSGGSTTISGRLNSTPNRTFTIQFFSSELADPSGFGEGETFIGQRSVSTNANGNVSFTFVPAQSVPVGWRVVATVTDDGGGNTSEFSNAVTAS